MSHRQRMEACLAGELLDRPPVALWRHFPVDDQAPEALAAATIFFQRTYDFDFVKVTPASSYCLKDWGIEDEWRGNHEGTRDYLGPVIQHPDEWGGLPVLDPGKGHLADQLDCLKRLVDELGPDVPVVQTIFSPLAQAKNLAGEEPMLAHLRGHADAFHAGLRAITASTQRFVEAAGRTGIAGVFYAVQHAQLHLLSRAEYREFGYPYDLQALEPAGDLWLNVLHLHGSQIFFDLFPDYPVQVINWHDQETAPTLDEGRHQFGGVVCGGLGRWESMVLGAPETIRLEARRAWQATGGRRFVLGTGCVTPITAPHGNLLAARQIVDEKGA